MGYTTDLIGQIDIHPRLNAAEQGYVAAFAASRRCRRKGGPYDVPHNPHAELTQGAREGDIVDSSATALGQPSLWCDWTPAWDGACLSHNGSEKSYQTTAWLAYLIDHFLGPNALAASSKLAWFDEFSFDHVLDGTIAACRRDTRELYLIEVENNRVFEETLVSPQPQWFDAGPLPYEETIDAFRRRPRRRPRRAS